MKKIGRFLFILLVATAVAAPAGWPADSYAKSKSYSSKYKKKSTSAKSSKSKSYRQADRDAALVVDADTGRVLYERNAANKRYPASLTKMMTLYLTFDALNKGALSLDRPLRVSKKAAAQPQTNINLAEGDRLKVRDAVESLVVRSANDAAMVLAEAIGGTEWNFGVLMTKKAHELGMKNTVFRNPSGLPDNKQHTTAFDMARLAIALRRDFPQYYHFFSMRDFDFKGVSYTTHNHVLDQYPGADGLKTGYIRASGFNLVTSVRRDGHNLVAVVMGGDTAAGRDRDMISMLDRTFARLDIQQHQNAAAGAREMLITREPPAAMEAQPIGQGG